jgi:hypothetical protein
MSLSMKSVLAYAAAIHTPLNLRVLSLLLDHKMTADALAASLKAPADEVAESLKQIAAAHLLKNQSKDNSCRLRSEAKDGLKEFFRDHKFTAKKDPTLRRDAKTAKIVLASLEQAARAAKRLQAQTLVSEQKQPTGAVGSDSKAKQSKAARTAKTRKA